MSANELVDRLTKGFDVGILTEYFKTACSKFRPDRQDLSEIIPEDQTQFKEVSTIGEVEYDAANRLIFAVCKLDKDLTGKESKKTQYELGKKILKQHSYDAGIFVFYGANNNFRLSLIVASYQGPKREFTTFRRYTYFVTGELTNKTFIKQFGGCDFSSIDNILEAFSIEAVSKAFYDDFNPQFGKILLSIKADDQTPAQAKKDFALLFVIRTLFLGFIQKKGWLGSEKFIQKLWQEYKACGKKDEFYSRLLEPLFF